jgi:hypothetical protein
MTRVDSLLAVTIFMLSSLAGTTLCAQQPGARETENSKAEAAADAGDRDQRLAKYLSGSKFVGRFTIDGKEADKPKLEAYTISKCEKLPKADMFRMTARIKYGDVDSEVPLDLQILWSGKTPVITLDSFWILGMGTFDARVLIHGDRYAGTWQHGKVGGHMLGKIVKE